MSKRSSFLKESHFFLSVETSSPMSGNCSFFEWKPILNECFLEIFYSILWMISHLIFLVFHRHRCSPTMRPYFHYYYYYYYFIEEAHGEDVRFFSPRCHIMPKWAHVPWKTVEWPSHLCEIWSHCLSTTSHTQFCWLGMVKGWCIAPA